MQQRPSGHAYRHSGRRGEVWRAKYRLPDGRQVHRTIGPAWTGRGRPRAGYFTKRTAEDWLRETLDQARRGTLPGMLVTGATFADAAAEFLRYIEHDRQRKPSTIRDYRSVIDNHLLQAFEAERLEDLTFDRLDRWAMSLGADQALSNRQKAKIITILHGVMAAPAGPGACPRTRRRPGEAAAGALGRDRRLLAGGGDGARARVRRRAGRRAVPDRRLDRSASGRARGVALARLGLRRIAGPRE